MSARACRTRGRLADTAGPARRGVQPGSRRRVLDLLNPQGMWRYIDRSTEPMPQVNEDDTSDLDPLTGCKPVTVAPQARQRPSS